MQRRVDRIDCPRQDIPEQEQQDPGRSEDARATGPNVLKRATGSPRKIVAPAIAPSRRMCPVDMSWLWRLAV